MRIRERITFLRQFRREFASTGSLQPSSRHLARAMTLPMREDPRPPEVARRIVEMGPGTGAVTRAIAQAMRPGDVLDCYELNPGFAAFLAKRVAEARDYRGVRDRIRVHAAAAEEASLTESIDFVICSIPLNNLTPEQARRILAVGVDLLGARGWFTYFEYPLLPALRSLVATAEERRRIDGVRELKAAFENERTRTRLVLRNLPPARAIHVPIHARPHDELDVAPHD